MSRQTYQQTPAGFLAAEGWGVGDVLKGEAMFQGGEKIEDGFTIRVSGIGKRAVLGETQHKTIPNYWGGEHSITFDCREWSRVVLALAN